MFGLKITFLTVIFLLLLIKMHQLKMNELIIKANSVYQQHFPPLTCFERAVFFSWGCTIGDCTFCYMSTQPAGKPPRETRRSMESILAEFILAKHLGWQIGFFTGGIGILKPEELEFLLKAAVEVVSEKIWLSVGPISQTLLKKYSPHIKGVVGSIETINPSLHRKVCPSKPIEPYEKMFLIAKDFGLQRAMTFIVGLGETHDDFLLLKNFIETYGITKIHVYGLIPQEGTAYGRAVVPSAEEQAWWIAQLRLAFPPIDIQCGIWEDRVARVSLLLRAGANSISKFKAVKLFGTPLAKEIEQEVAKAGRTFCGTLTKLPDIDWDAKVMMLSLSSELKQRIKFKLNQYLKGMD